MYERIEAVVIPPAKYPQTTKQIMMGGVKRLLTGSYKDLEAAAEHLSEGKKYRFYAFVIRFFVYLCLLSCIARE